MAHLWELIILLSAQNVFLFDRDQLKKLGWKRGVWAVFEFYEGNKTFMLFLCNAVSSFPATLELYQVKDLWNIGLENNSTFTDFVTYKYIQD